MKETPVCFNNTATVLKYLTWFFFPCKDDYVVRTENVNTVGQGKQSSRGYWHSAVSH